MVLDLQACALCVCLCACLPACSCFVWAHIFHLRLNVTEIHKQLQTERMVATVVKVLMGSGKVLS